MHFKNLLMNKRASVKYVVEEDVDAANRFVSQYHMEDRLTVLQASEMDKVYEDREYVPLSRMFELLCYPLFPSPANPESGWERAGSTLREKVKANLVNAQRKNGRKRKRVPTRRNIPAKPVCKGMPGTACRHRHRAACRKQKQRKNKTLC